ncbi:MAG: SDR family oxidoreductase [Acidobacteria bacterium]|nr:SDR family oxidoreductase [Acidobacteriota bacterium]
MLLTSKVVLLTGARRMGPVIADRLTARGAHVVVTYRGSSADADEVVTAARARGAKALAVQTDVSDPSSVAALMATVEASFGRLDVVVNMASIYESVAFDAMTEDDWHRQLGVDLHGTFRVCRAAVPLLRRSGGGRIINFTDWVVASGRPRYEGYVAYYVAKAGVKALTEVLALELARDGILVNAVAPGPILPPPGTSAAETQAVVDATPLGRWGGPDEIAKVIDALIDSDFITGETIRVDGGRHIR